MGNASQDMRINYQVGLINQYNRLMDTLWDGQHNDILLSNQDITGDLRQKAHEMGMTAFYEYAIPIMERLLS